MANVSNTKHKDETFERDRGFGAIEKGREMASEAAAKAGDLASDVAKKAGDAASTVGQKAEDATAAVGSGMKNLAGTIRERGPDGGMLGNVSSGVARTLESGGEYLEERGLSGIGKDMTEMIRRNPLPALLVGIGLGYLLARATRH